MVWVKEKRDFISVLTRLFRGAGRFLRRPGVVVVFFVAVNLLPNVLLCFTEPLSGLGKGILVVGPAGVYLVLFSLNRRVGVMPLWLSPLWVFHAFQLVLLYLYGESVIAVDMFLNLPTTNASEAGELLGSIWPAVGMVGMLYLLAIVLAVVAVWGKWSCSARCQRWMMGVGIGLLVASGVGIVAEKERDARYAMRNAVYPVNVLYNLGYAIQKWQRSEAYPETSASFTFQAIREGSPGRREIYVLVIGEAARAGNWSLWGYERETNPELKRVENLVIYKDALTQSNTTHKSVPLILSAADAEHYERLYGSKSVLTAFKEVGFKTLFLSNQIPNRSFTDYFAAEADVHVVIRTSSEGGLVTYNNYDGVLVPLVKYYADSLADEDLFIVLHTYGSHFNYKERYPPKFARFQPDAVMDIEYKNKAHLVNAYDNSVLYSDYFLARLIDTLRRMETESVLIYSSDHGEDLWDDERRKFLHASPVPTYYQLHIPLFIWFSPAYKEWQPVRYEEAVRHASLPVATNVIFHTLLDLARVRTPYWDSTLSVVHPGFKQRPRMYLNDHDQPINYYKVGLKWQDTAMIKRLGLDHSLE